MSKIKIKSKGKETPQVQDESYARLRLQESPLRAMNSSVTAKKMEQDASDPS